MISNQLIHKRAGISKLLVLLVIIGIGIAVLGGGLYFKVADFLQLGTARVEQGLQLIDQIENVDQIDNIKELKDLEKLEGIENIEEFDALTDLEVEDIKQINNMSPIVRNIFEWMPNDILDSFTDSKEENN